MARVDGQRGQDRVDLVEEALAQRVVVLGDLVVIDDLDALGREGGADVAEDRGMVGDQLQDASPGGDELLHRRPSIRSPGDRAGFDLLAQPGDADLEELVEVAGEDGQELRALEQRIPLIAGLVEDARVELQPRQLTVEERQLRLRLGSASRARRDDGSCRGGRWCAGLDGGHRASVDLRAATCGLTHPGVPGLAGEDSTSP